MREKPILFSAAMVRAILEGRKTMTRRVIKDIRTAWRDGTVIDPYDRDYITCPYGWPGDLLWVRETWRRADWYGKGIIYRADAQAAGHMGEYSDRHKWHPSIHMPRWASRIVLEITNIRVERLQEITEEDARKEGISRAHKYPVGFGHPDTYRGGFRNLWDSINGKKYPWSSNPWVWVISFKKNV